MNALNKILESVRIKAALHDLACEMEISQMFRNGSKHNVEAVYTFPLPYNAVLLELVAKVGEKELRGAVLPKAEAEEQYEKSITDGDGAIMLERSDNGICTVNVGNLLPGEVATLTYRYAYMLSWQQGTVKFRLPTTIAPRYGDSINSGYQPHQIPEANILAENKYSLQISVVGLLAQAQAVCPSHEVVVQRKKNKTEINLKAHEAFMDRDFVLDFQIEDAADAAGMLASDSISGGQVAIASFCPRIPGGELPSVCVKIVVDCSGSMAGDSIDQTRIGLLRVLDNLREEDTFNIIRFGDTQRAVFTSCVPAKERNLRNARSAVDQLTADMGGTKMADALDFACSIKDGGERQATILLITDGDISDHRELTRLAVKSKHRVFTVGVGSAVAEEFVRNIAERTGGACELVSPNEVMADSIYRQFRRMFQPQAVIARVEWPTTPDWQAPSNLGAVFGGDTVHVFAGFSKRLQGEVRLLLQLSDGREVTQNVLLNECASNADALTRIAAARHIENIEADNPELAKHLALDYQLVTEQTNYLILEEREEDHKAQDLPHLARVTQMLAAGWGGTGSVKSPVAKFGKAQDSEVQYCEFPSTTVMRSGRNLDVMQSGVDTLDSPFFLRKNVDEETSRKSFGNYLAILKSIFWSKKQNLPDKQSQEISKPDLKALVKNVIESGDKWLEVFMRVMLPALPQDTRALFNKLVAEDGHLESEVAAAMLALITKELNMEDEYAEFGKTDYAEPTLVSRIKSLISSIESKLESDQVE